MVRTQIFQTYYKLFNFKQFLLVQDTVPKPEKRTKMNHLVNKLLFKAIDGYFASGFLVGIMVSLTPFFLDLDPSYFLLKLFVPPNQTKSFWVSCLRSIWMITAIHRWVLTGGYIFLYAFASFYFFWKGFGGVNRTLSESLMTQSTLSKTVSNYKQLYLLMHCQNSVGFLLFCSAEFKKFLRIIYLFC